MKVWQSISLRAGEHVTGSAITNQPSCSQIWAVIMWFNQGFFFITYAFEQLFYFTKVDISKNEGM